MSDTTGAAAVSDRQRPRFDLEQEVRFAVVMYGGVSLAIYINGVAQELFRLVRATAPERPHAEAELQAEQTQRVYFPNERDGTGRKCTDGSERVYRTLGQILNAAGPPRAKADIAEPVRTRFVVDIISGTSAGGINGVFLATAIANQQEFGVSADLWLDVADIDDLLRADESFADLPPDTPRDAQSLLNGFRLYWKAREAMRAMAAGPREEFPEDPWMPAFADQLDLAVTATDLAGLAKPIRLAGDKAVAELGHRTVFRFSYGTEKTTGEQHSDFEDMDLMLGFAARATSSFPFAFEPVRLADIRPLDVAEYDATDVERFFAEHRRNGLRPERVVFADGGYLDNKPFTYATEALRSRRADVPVRRKLVFIEPDPMVEAPRASEAPERPDVFASVAASVALPRHETIREDIAAVGERNRVVERLRELGLYAERALARADPLAPLRDDAAATDDAVAERLLGTVGPQYAAYRSLRVRAVLDELAAFAEDLRGDGDAASVRPALRASVEQRHERDQRSFLAAYDSAFQRRRLSFLHDRINELLRRGSRADEMVTLAEQLAGDGVTAAELHEQAEPLRTLKLNLNEAVDGLRRAARAPHAHTLAKVLPGLQLEVFEEVRRCAQLLPGDAPRYMASIGAFLAEPLAEADREIRAALQTAPGLAAWIRLLLQAYDERFQAFDMMVLPLAYPDLGEVNAVEILRISPLDAPSIQPDSVDGDATAKLAGVRVRHFGGFLDQSWRRNDLMWGRLDAAETIIDTLLADAPDEQRRRLREQAQAAILREPLSAPLPPAVEQKLSAAPSEAADRDLVDTFRRAYEPPKPLGGTARNRLASRSLRIAGGVLAAGARDRGLPAWPFTAAGRLAPAIARLAPGVTRLRGWRPRPPQVRWGWPPISRRDAKR